VNTTQTIPAKAVKTGRCLVGPPPEKEYHWWVGPNCGGAPNWRWNL